MKYFYNEQNKCFAVYTNFVPKEKPKGYKEISKAKYEELQEALNQESNQEEGEE